MSDIRYIENLFTSENPLQKKIRESLKEHDLEGVQITSLQGQFICFLLSLMKATKIVEVGVLHGYSLSWILRAKLHEPKIWAFEKNEDHLKQAQKLLAAQDQSVEFILGDAKQELEKINAQGPFDFIFIDANKSGYPAYLKWAKKNIATGGVIALDNSLLNGQLLSPTPKERFKKLIEKIKACNEDLAKDPQFTSLIFPTPEGLTLAYKS